MNTQNSAPVAPQIQPNLSHRHGNKNPQTPYQLRDAVETILGRAEAVIALVQLHLTNDATGETDQPNPEIYYFGLESVTCDLMDIRALVDAFSKSRA